MNSTLRKKCLYSELFWSVFSRIQNVYGEILAHGKKQKKKKLLLETKRYIHPSRQLHV